MAEPTTPAAAAKWLPSYCGRTAAFVRDVLHERVYRAQERIYDAWDQSKWLAVRKARGVGGTHAAQRCALAHFATQRALVLITGPTYATTVETNWIPGIHRAMLGSAILPQMFAVTTSSIVARSDAFKKSWGCIGIASETSDFISGIHHPRLAWFVDEAAAVARQVFTTLLGGLTQPGNKCLLIGTPPVQRVGFANSVFEGEAGDDWTCLTIPASEALAPDGPVSLESLEEKARTLGKDSPDYAVQVYGVPADRQRTTLIGLSHVHRAFHVSPLFRGERQPGEIALPYEFPVPDEWTVEQRRRHGEPVEQFHNVIAIDPTGGGTDLCVAARRKGSALVELRELDASSEETIAHGILAMQREDPADTILVERGGGYGRGAIEIVRREHKGIVQWWDPSGSVREHTCANARSEAWLNFSHLLAGGHISLIPDRLGRLELALAAVGRRTTEQGKTAITPKEQLIESLGWSPDHADAVVICFSGYRPGKGDSATVVVQRLAI